MQAREYQVHAKRTVRINWAHKHGSDIAVLGVIGELGSLASVVKKRQRDEEAYSAYEDHLIEELGDILWYITCVSSRMGVVFDEWPKIFPEIRNAFEGVYALHDHLIIFVKHKESLSGAAGGAGSEILSAIGDTLACMQAISKLIGSDLSIVAEKNCCKTLSYWGKVPNLPARIFDVNLPGEQQLPRKFCVDFVSSIDGRVINIVMNGDQIGNSLTDNSYKKDDYRFHDVFHLAGAAVLGWSPVLRKIMKRKRKADLRIDEVEDGARAQIIEEAVINHVFDYARDCNFLQGMKKVDLELLKRIGNLVRGYEVSICEPWEWQDCILEGFKAFRDLQQHGGGRIQVDAENRSLFFEKLPA